MRMPRVNGRPKGCSGLHPCRFLLQRTLCFHAAFSKRQLAQMAGQGPRIRAMAATVVVAKGDPDRLLVGHGMRHSRQEDAVVGTRWQRVTWPAQHIETEVTAGSLEGAGRVRLFDVEGLPAP